MSEIKLAPCQKCRGEAFIRTNQDSVSWGRCKLGCWDGPVMATPEQAAEAWNSVMGLWALGPEIMNRIRRAICICVESDFDVTASDLEKTYDALHALGIRE